MDKNVLFISHTNKQCGVHEFGYNVGHVLQKSSKYKFVYVECDSLDELHNAINQYQPIAIIYNYYPSTIPWVRKKLVHTTYTSLIEDIKLPQIGIMHEVTQQKADEANTKLFDYHIAPDPTLLLKNPIVFKTGRLIPSYQNSYTYPEIITVGSFGFATPKKGFEEIVKAVNSEFDKAVIRFNIPFATFGDNDGAKAKALVYSCKMLITKPDITLVVTHDFLDKQQVLDFLAKNTINVFLYQDKDGRGLSSTIDYALAVDRPIAVSDSIMFRHLHNIQPSIVYGQSTLQQIINQGTEPLKYFNNEWNNENLIWEYERIIDAVLNAETKKKSIVPPTPFKQFKNSIRGLLGLKNNTFSWLRNTDAATEDIIVVDKKQSYYPIIIPQGVPLNRILDDSARALYKPAENKLIELVPLTMGKKIAEANVQQAFVFDTVMRFTKEFTNPKMLCVGSYEDTAAMGLKCLGFNVEEVDPVINYYLQEYFTKPTTVKESYDIIFSTSVIEHDPNDESFIKCIGELLAPNGIAVITCDYNDQWKPGLPKPDVDARFYTLYDLKTRLLSIIPDCELVDEPQWECPNPDFNYLGKYQYTFASFVIRKTK